ncbi:hypothetical protein GCM10022217_24170 [Chryseobacterium ginsenosidimutans]|uniref:helix-turn-helix domain-containing protein n=1 Tax=Chryseobacterium ginsenosidimutans TaxID=687846 RepID=UPI0031E189C3
MKMTTPDYKRIYSDLIAEKFPDRKECKIILSKERLSELDVITLNNILFKDNNKDTTSLNQKHRSYNQDTILEILRYQKKNKLNNIQVAKHFKLSRNTVAKWKKIFLF